MPGMENFAPVRTLTSSGFSGSPSFLPICPSSFASAVEHLLVDLVGNLVAVLEEDVADFGRDGEAGRHGHAGPAHLGEAGAFAAEDVFHLAVAVGSAAAKAINVVFIHFCSPEVTISEKSAIVENSRKHVVQQLSRFVADLRIRRVHHHFVEEPVDAPAAAPRSSSSADRSRAAQLASIGSSYSSCSGPVFEQLRVDHGRWREIPPASECC